MSEASVKLTKNQKLVFDVLRQEKAPLTAYAILDQLRDAGFRAPAQVYRGLEKLMELGLIHRLETLNAYVACSHSHGAGGGVIFTICDQCGGVEEFCDEALSQKLAERARESAFTVDRSIVELHGACGSCGEAAK